MRTARKTPVEQRSRSDCGTLDRSNMQQAVAAIVSNASVDVGDATRSMGPEVSKASENGHLKIKMGMKTTRRLPKATCVPSIGVKCMYSRLRRISGYVLWNPGAPHFTGFQRTYPEILLGAHPIN